MDMPIETQEQLVEEDIVTDTRADTFLISLLAKRKEAIDGRAGSGIEQDWAEDEEHYQGIDDANRAYATTSNVIQAKNWAERYSRENPTGTRSVIFLNITRPYVDAGSARVADMLLPTDDRSWAIKPTPIPRLSPAQMQMMGGPENAQIAIEQSIEIAKEAAKAMQDEIDDCVNESNWHGEIRHVIEDSARIGSGCIKGPYPVKRSARMYQKTDGVSVMTQIDEIKPGSKRIACENLYPDPACGESIHNGSYIWEREDISGKQLLDLIKLPGYDKLAVMQALKEGPKTAVVGSSTRPVAKSEEQFELWIFYGTCDADDLGAVGVEMDDETPKAAAMAVLVNDRLIKCTLNALDTGEFPYDVLAWQRCPGMPWGSGVGRHIRTVQRMLNGAARAMMDNAGLTASPQIIIGNGVSPADGKTAITGGKLWRADTDTLDVRGAFHAFVPPSIQVEMMNIINFALKLAEDTTGMPAMLQGIRGDAPETLGGMQLQDTRASGVLRRLAKRFDDYMTEPHIRRYYDWMMQHSDREDIKGDFQIDVRASSALVERDAQQQFLLTLLTAAANPIYELDPAKLAAELLKGQRYDPKRIQYSPEKLAQLQDTSNPVEEAKAKLIAAQTLKTAAETTTKNVEGMFSATSAANQIAMVPSIAPLADAMLLSAGFVDANAAPAIPEVPDGVQGVPMPSNTSPNFPPQPGTPPNPDVGMDAGIETGAQIDGDEDRD
jgi:hypothetical protein